MYSRIFSGVFLLLVSACNGASDEGGAETKRATTAADPSASAPRIDCAIGGGEYAPACTVAREEIDGAAVLTVRHPDGGFRLLRVTADGEVTAADGAVPAAVSTGAAGATEVAIDGDRYRLPPGALPAPEP